MLITRILYPEAFKKHPSQLTSSSSSSGFSGTATSAKAPARSSFPDNAGRRRMCIYARKGKKKTADSGATATEKKEAALNRIFLFFIKRLIATRVAAVVEVVRPAGQ